MQPVAAQDRPKLIAMMVAIIIALAFVAHGMAGPANRTPPPGPEKTAITASASESSRPLDAAPRSQAATAAGDEAVTAPARFDAPARPKLHDPFRPLTAIRVAVSPARASSVTPPAAAAPVVRPASRRALPAAVSVSPRADGTSSARRPAQRMSRPPAAPAEAAQAPVILIGTVGSGAAAVATFHVGAETVFARPEEVVAGWRVARIQVGQAWLSRQNRRQLLRVGNSLPGGPRLADREATVPAG